MFMGIRIWWLISPSHVAVQNADNRNQPYKGNADGLNYAHCPYMTWASPMTAH